MLRNQGHTWLWNVLHYNLDARDKFHSNSSWGRHECEIFQSGPKWCTDQQASVAIPRARLLAWVKTHRERRVVQIYKAKTDSDRERAESQLRKMHICTEKHYFDGIVTRIRMARSISSLSIHYLSILFPDTGSIPQCWTQHDHVTDGKSILSSPLLTEHMAGEEKHLETPRHLKATVAEDTATYSGQSTATNTVRVATVGV